MNRMTTLFSLLLASSVSGLMNPIPAQAIISMAGNTPVAIDIHVAHAQQNQDIRTQETRTQETRTQETRTQEETPLEQLPQPPITLFNNLSNYRHLISTANILTQRYFNQGLILAYGFNHAEAARSFQEAARLDPNCAMCYWGIAYVLGPNINAPMEANAVPQAWDALQRAIALSDRASQRERAYIQALAMRYSLEPDADRADLDLAYANAMREVARRYPDDLDAATLYAEALMDTTPWDYWEDNGGPKPIGMEIMTTLESILTRNPDHPGANHLYIHAVKRSVLNWELRLPIA